MSSTSVIYSKPPTDAEWEGMKSIITEIWSNRARNNEDLVEILRREYGFLATKKTCTTRAQRWGLSTYKKRAAPSGQGETSQSVRKRSGPLLRREPGPRPLRHIIPSPATNRLFRPNIYQPPELMQYSIDRFVASIFGDSVQQFTHFDLMRSELDESLRWQRIADLYCTAENNFHDERIKKFMQGLANTHQELRLLVRRHNPKILRLSAKIKDLSTLKRLQLAIEPPSIDVQRVRYHAFLARFWRICYQLLEKDLTSRYEFSFLADFLLELEKLFYTEYGKQHPLRELLFALCQVPKADMQNTLKLGASRTIRVMAPGITSSEKLALVVRQWTGYSNRLDRLPGSV